MGFANPLDFFLISSTKPKLSATGKIASIVDLIDSSLGTSLIISSILLPQTEYIFLKQSLLI